MSAKKVIELAVVAVLMLIIVWFGIAFGINITAAQISWSSVTFSLGFIVGALLAMFYLKRRAFLRTLKRLARAIKKKS